MSILFYLKSKTRDIKHVAYRTYCHLKYFTRTKKEEKLPDNIKPEMIGEKRYFRMVEGAKRYSMGLNTFRNMAAEAHAIIHVKNYADRYKDD